MEDSPKGEEPNENENEGMEEGDSEEISFLYEWVDSMPLSRPKKNISRDFNDAVLLAEILKYHFPKLVELHNYPNASSTKQKISNWETLNKKVLKKIGLSITKEEMDNLAGSRPNAIEGLLLRVYRLVKGIPQSPGRRRKENHKDKEDYGNNENKETAPRRGKNGEEDALNQLIFEKDQEILKLKEHIEMLEREINDSYKNQTILENRLRELNEVIRNNEIEFN
ncbi:MAG: calponin homology domain-containing protein [archaeon]|nr:calponin homology domain-containing protein [archaeon]